jgi:hypothetical protein
MALTPEQEEYFDALEDLFAMPGWKILQEDALSQIYQYQAEGLEQPTWEAVCTLRGKAAQLAEFTRLEEVTLYQKALLEEAEEDEDADV